MHIHVPAVAALGELVAWGPGEKAADSFPMRFHLRGLAASLEAAEGLPPGDVSDLGELPMDMVLLGDPEDSSFVL